MRKAHNELFSLDVLALSLLSCLLASVVGILVLSGADQKLHQRVHLDQGTFELSKEIDETQSSLEDIDSRLKRASLVRQKRVVESEADGIRQKIEARQKIAQAEAEIEVRKKELEKLTPAETENPDQPNPFGNYRGPFILVECVKDRSNIFPGKARLGLKPTAEEIDSLVERIQEAGFVLFIVRPSGWFANAFYHLQGVVDTKLDEAHERGAKAVGRAVLPLADGTPLTPYLPPEKPVQ